MLFNAERLPSPPVPPETACDLPPVVTDLMNFYGWWDSDPVAAAERGVAVHDEFVEAILDTHNLDTAESNEWLVRGVRLISNQVTGESDLESLNTLLVYMEHDEYDRQEIRKFATTFCYRAAPYSGATATRLNCKEKQAKKDGRSLIALADFLIQATAQEDVEVRKRAYRSPAELVAFECLVESWQGYYEIPENERQTPAEYRQRLLGTIISSDVSRSQARELVKLAELESQFRLPS